MYKLTPEQLLTDLYQAYHDACKHKRKKAYVRQFQQNLDSNLMQLRDELWTRTYKALPSSCFIVTYPKHREVFAAEFRDRIVHHLYYNYTQELFSRTFIKDTYSCLPGRGTHFGIDRLEQHIRQESRSYTRPCYVLKMDISGYFMHINRQRLLDLCLATLHSMANHRILKRVRTQWRDVLDIEFLEYLSREIILLNPIADCHIVGRLSDWEGLPASKSLFRQPEGRGLPIGNLTSQLFSNVYLNVLDQWMKRDKHCRHYGRYVDDFFVVSNDILFLRNVIQEVVRFLAEKLALAVQRGKTIIRSVYYGVSFLGAYLKPWRRYVENKTIQHMKVKLNELKTAIGLEYSLNSFLGVLGHYRSYNIRRQLMLEFNDFSQYGFFDISLRKFRKENDIDISYRDDVYLRIAS